MQCNAANRLHVIQQAPPQTLATCVCKCCIAPGKTAAPPRHKLTSTPDPQPPYGSTAIEYGPYWNSYMLEKARLHRDTNYAATRQGRYAPNSGGHQAYQGVNSDAFGIVPGADENVEGNTTMVEVPNPSMTRTTQSKKRYVASERCLP